MIDKFFHYITQRREYWVWDKLQKKDLKYFLKWIIFELFIIRQDIFHYRERLGTSVSIMTISAKQFFNSSVDSRSKPLSRRSNCYRLIDVWYSTFVWISSVPITCNMACRTYYTTYSHAWHLANHGGFEKSFSSSYLVSDLYYHQMTISECKKDFLTPYYYYLQDPKQWGSQCTAILELVDKTIIITGTERKWRNGQ